MPSSNISYPQFLTWQLGALCVWFAFQIDSFENGLKSATILARYIIHLLTARGIQQAFALAQKSLSTKKLSLPKLFKENKLSWLTYGIAVFVIKKSGLTIFGEDFFLIMAAFLVCQYLKTKRIEEPTINYGRGMACSFYEGYIKHVIPSDGKQDGLVDKIRKWEDKQRVPVPVKCLFLVIPRSLYCPPDLRQFNLKYLNRPDKPQLSCTLKPLEKVIKNVAGVVNRQYQNTIYKISYPDHSHEPVYVVAECATPLHTLHGVLQNHHLYRELVNVDKELLMNDFVDQLNTILERDDATRGQCVLVDFDDRAGSSDYLPTVLLNKVAELEHSYLAVIARHKRDYPDLGIPMMSQSNPNESSPEQEHPSPGLLDEQFPSMDRLSEDLGEPDLGAMGARVLVAPEI